VSVELFGKDGAEMTDEEERGEARHYNLALETGSFKLTGHEAELKIIAKAVKKNPLLMGVYGVIAVVGLFASYFSSGWFSVAITFVVDVLTLFVGWHMAHEVIKETIR
jgi:hypothetical protein